MSKKEFKKLLKDYTYDEITSASHFLIHIKKDWKYQEFTKQETVKAIKFLRDCGNPFYEIIY